jgi:hypothetical protein
MKTLPELGEILYGANGAVRVTRITAVSGKYRWCYYRDVDTDDFHCQRLDLFLQKHSDDEYKHLVYS